MTQAPRVLVLSASVGAGHLRAAQAVELALKEVAPAAEVHNVDVLSLTNSAFRHFYGKAYLDLVNRAPHLLGFVYDYLDRPRRPNSPGDRLRLALEKANLRKLVRLLTDQPWHLLISTHFLPAEIAASLRRAGRLTTPHVTVTTDFETHRLWVNQPCDHYFTATEEGARALHHWSVPPADTTVTGIPIHPVFSRPKARADCLARHGLAGDRPVVLQLGGGFGVGPVAHIFEQLLGVERPLDLVVVAGRNARVKAQLESASLPPRHRVKVLGFTDAIDELMAVADLVVSKPGGLTTSEALSRAAPMVVVSPIPGQEGRNSDFLLEQGAAIKVNNLATLGFKVATLLDDPVRLAQLRGSAARIARPRAAHDVAERALTLVRRPPLAA